MLHCKWNGFSEGEKIEAIFASNLPHSKAIVRGKKAIVYLFLILGSTASLD